MPSQISESPDMKTILDLVDFYDRIVCMHELTGWNLSAEYIELRDWCIYHGFTPDQMYMAMDYFNGEIDEKTLQDGQTLE